LSNKLSRVIKKVEKDFWNWCNNKNKIKKGKNDYKLIYIFIDYYYTYGWEGRLIIEKTVIREKEKLDQK
jgi:hypothetical protein